MGRRCFENLLQYFRGLENGLNGVTLCSLLSITNNLFKYLCPICVYLRPSAVKIAPPTRYTLTIVRLFKWKYC